MPPVRSFAITVDETLPTHLQLGTMGSSTRVLVRTLDPVELGAVAQVHFLSEAGRELLTVAGLVGECVGGPPYQIKILLNSPDANRRRALAALLSATATARAG